MVCQLSKAKRKYKRERAKSREQNRIEEDRNRQAEKARNRAEEKDAASAQSQYYGDSQAVYHNYESQSASSHWTQQVDWTYHGEQRDNQTIETNAVTLQPGNLSSGHSGEKRETIKTDKVTLKPVEKSAGSSGAADIEQKTYFSFSHGAYASDDW